MLQLAGSWRKRATTASDDTPQVACVECSMMEPWRSMSQRKGTGSAVVADKDAGGFSLNPGACIDREWGWGRGSGSGGLV